MFQGNIGILLAHFLSLFFLKHIQVCESVVGIQMFTYAMF